jgi:outer membrane immunogenic protein
MRRISTRALAAASVLAFATVAASELAQAADLPQAAQIIARRAPAPAPYSWTGLYAGVDLGYQWSSGDVFVPAGPVLGTAAVEPNSISLGGHIGYRYQFPNRFVIGVEGDIAWLDGDRAAAFPGLPVLGVKGTTNWDASVRGTLGFAFDRALIYGTGGASWIDADGCLVVMALPTTCIPGTSLSHTYSGWVAGGGVAFAFAGNFTARIEYLHADYGTTSFSTPGFGVATNVKATTDKVRAGLSLRLVGP